VRKDIDKEQAKDIHEMKEEGVISEEFAYDTYNDSPSGGILDKVVPAGFGLAPLLLFGGVAVILGTKLLRK
jgi:hypothetical protein